MRLEVTAKQTILEILRNPAKTLLVALIRFYQVVISPGLRSRCKYYPSCSQYALDAVEEYGAARGLVLAFWRVLRCNPLSYGGYDPASRQRLFSAKKSRVPCDQPTTASEAEHRRPGGGDHHRPCRGDHHLVRG